MTKRLQEMTDDQLRELTYEDYGQTLYLDANTAGNLLELKRLLGSPTLEAAARIAIERQVIQQGGRMLETRPLVSLGQGEYRRDIMAEDV
jgi:hypothetical protein